MRGLCLQVSLTPNADNAELTAVVDDCIGNPSGDQFSPSSSALPYKVSGLLPVPGSPFLVLQKPERRSIAPARDRLLLQFPFATVDCRYCLMYSTAVLAEPSTIKCVTQLRRRFSATSMARVSCSAEASLFTLLLLYL